MGFANEKVLNLAAIKTMSARRSEAKKRNVEVTLCVVDEAEPAVSGKAAVLHSTRFQFAQKKARHSASTAHLPKRRRMQ